MTVATKLFEVELEGDTLIVTPTRDLHELDFRDIEREGAVVFERLRRGTARNVVLDLHRISLCGSTALGAFVQLWRVAKSRQGRMALCNISEREREILEATNLDTLWLICTSRDEAMSVVNRTLAKAAS